MSTFLVRKNRVKLQIEMVFLLICLEEIFKACVRHLLLIIVSEREAADDYLTGHIINSSVACVES